MNPLEAILSWFSTHESALSGMAAFVALLALVFSPLGRGLRRFLRPARPSPAEEPAALSAPTLALDPSAVESDAASGRLTAAVRRGLAAALANVSGLIFVTAEAEAEYIAALAVERAGARYRGMVTVRDHAGEQFWSCQYDGEDPDDLRAQDDLVLRIANGVRFAVFDRDGEGPQPDDALPTVRHRISRAGALLNRQTPANYDRAERLVDRVLDAEPDNAAALSMAAVISHREFNVGRGAASSERARRAIELARRAQQLNPRSDIAYNVEGIAMLQLREYDAARRAFDRVFEINPHYWGAMWGMACVEVFSGAPEAAIPWAQRSVSYDASSVLNHFGLRAIALSELCLGRAREALDPIQRADQLQQDLLPNLLILSAAAAHAGEPGLAGDAATRVAVLDPGCNLATIPRWPFRDDEPWEHLLAGWRLAGLPEP